MQKQDRPIAFFDSGLGGISVLRETVRLLPQENYLYYGDSLHAPYGVKSEQEIRALVDTAIRRLIEDGAKALVIAKYRLNQQDLTQDEFGILCKLAHGIASLMPPVDKYLYLDCSVSTIIEHMRQRGREYEDDLDLMYVYELKELYDEWAETLPPERTLRINMDGGEYDLDEIVRFLEA